MAYIKMLDVQLIRIEHKDGYGIFRSLDDNSNFRWNVYNDTNPLMKSLCERHIKFPSPFEEGYSLSRNEFCGFKTIDQILEWFSPEELKYILSNDFDIYLIKVNFAIVTDYQVFFQKDNTISKEKITSLFM